MTAALLMSLNSFASNEQRPLQVTDIMKFNDIVTPQLSTKGKWLFYSATPDRGDSTFHIQSTQDDRHFKIEYGNKGTISNNEKYAAVTILPSLLSQEQTEKKKRKELKNNLEVIELLTGKRTTYLNVEQYGLSDQFGYVAFLSEQKISDTDTNKTDELEQDATSEQTSATDSSTDEIKLFNNKRINKQLTLVNIDSGEQQVIKNVDRFSFSPKQPILVYSTSNSTAQDNALFAFNFVEQSSKTIVREDSASFDELTWDHDGEKLAFMQGDFSQENDVRKHTAKIYQSKNNKINTITSTAPKWYIPINNRFTWSKDDERVFLGFKPSITKSPQLDTKPENADDLFNISKLTEARNLQIWHGDDPLIKTNEKYQNSQDKKSFFTAVYHLRERKLIHLADDKVINVKSTNNEHTVIGHSDLNYRKLRTWEGFFSDFYHINLSSGKKSLIAEKLSSYAQMKVSENGRYVAYYQGKDVWVFDNKRNKKFNLTEKLPVSFSDEDHDYPSKTPGYGIAGWLEDDNGILVYDKFDIWLLQKDGQDGQCLTCDVGRPNSLKFRINTLDKDNEYIAEAQTLLLTSYNDDRKNYGFYSLNLQTNKLVKLLEEKKKFSFIGKAEKADTIIFSRQDYNEFPDIWVSDLNPANGKKLTDVNPQKAQFLWGQPELVEWRSNMGVKHQGVLIKPANHVEGMKYPVVVYYYRLFSQRMYEFNAMKVNHRPNFPFYTSNGYAIFLPDVHFEIGTPGHSTNKSILPGLQKIIDMGIADPSAIGLHGHSWSGYQTLHAITETDMFAAAVSGAPVANMTSAYSGIRLGTGLARQFQYEQGQSRIGASLFERRDLYIENSPVFFADRINTPLLMQFGDVDDAVPWQQGVEMYLAMRRLQKEVILLQYEGEPHHLKKYPNKVDYTIKMKQYFDHYLKGAPAANWMVDGEAYREIKK